MGRMQCFQSMKVVVPSLRVSRQNGLNPQEYREAMMMELEALDGRDYKRSTTS